jgi:Transposase domain (DUF772)
MMGRQIGDQTSLFYEFRLDDRIPKEHLLRRINLFLTPVLGGMHEQLASYYSEIGRPSIDPELMVRMLIVGYCYGLGSAGSTLMTRFRTIRHSRRTDFTGSGRAMSFAGYSSASSLPAWPPVWSRAKDLLSMRA